MYYISNRDKVFSSYEVRRHIGINPSKFTNLDMLNRLGVYPVSDNAPEAPNSRLYDVTSSYTVNGNYAVKSFNSTVKPLASIQSSARSILKARFTEDVNLGTVYDIDALTTQLNTDLNTIDTATDAQSVATFIET